MSEINRDANELLINSLANYSLAEIMHHIVGNELAIISGYTQLLLREEDVHKKEPALPDMERLAQSHEKRLSYLQTMKRSEEEMNNFLVQLRGCPLVTAERRFSEHIEKTDLVSVFKQFIETLAPLYHHRTLQIRLPVQPLYVLCSRLWMMLVLEHVVTPLVAAHTASTPVVIGVEEYVDPARDVHTARIGIHITRGSAEQKSEIDEAFEVGSHELDERDRDLCLALCGAILREHGGCLGREKETEQREVVYIELPLVK